VERLAPLFEDHRDKLPTETSQPSEHHEDHGSERLLFPDLLNEPVEVGVQSLMARGGGNGLGIGLGLGICRGHEGVFLGKLKLSQTPAYLEDPLLSNLPK
jgi:hypothetical protein